MSGPLREHDARLEDGDLVVRPLTEDDWDAIDRWALDPEVLFLAELEAVPERSLAAVQATARAESEVGRWMIELDGEPVGDVRVIRSTPRTSSRRGPARRCGDSR